MESRQREEDKEDEETSLEKFQDLIREWETEHSANG